MRFLYTLFFVFFITGANAQNELHEHLNDSFQVNNFSITYDISITGQKKRSIAETYNGAVKTIFVKDNSAKLRLVSLMRIQNIYYRYKAKDTGTVAVVVKESGKNKYKFRLGQSNWDLFNSKYRDIKTSFSDDSLIILGRVCKKATLELKDGSKLVAYYLPALKNETLMAAEPMFAQLPGIVMKYEYREGKKSIVYTASGISLGPLPDAVFTVPVKGYPSKKFAPGKTFKGNIPEDDDSEED